MTRKTTPAAAGTRQVELGFVCNVYRPAGTP